MKARVTVTLKTGVLDPQGKAIEGALGGLGFSGINAVRQGKTFDIDIDRPDADTARQDIDQMCRQLLANLVIENYAIDIVDDA
jgi:phosphoribosylformylglycinamidine synthase PurS subunit